jgi:hypothetical protein
MEFFASDMALEGGISEIAARLRSRRNLLW